MPILLSASDSATFLSQRKVSERGNYQKLYDLKNVFEREIGSRGLIGVIRFLFVLDFRLETTRLIKNRFDDVEFKGATNNFRNFLIRQSNPEFSRHFKIVRMAYSSMNLHLLKRPSKRSMEMKSTQQINSNDDEVKQLQSKVQVRKVLR